MSNWRKIGQAIAPFSKVVGGALGGPAGAIAGGMLAKALGVPSDPDSVSQAIAADPAAARAAAEEVEKTRRAEIEAASNAAEEVSRTMRAEIKSDDKYVRRWRPTFGYVVCAVWGLQGIAIFVAAGAATWLAAFSPDETQAVSALLAGMRDLIGSLSVQWGIALSVLGVSVAARSKDKRGGVESGGGIGGLINTLRGGK